LKTSIIILGAIALTSFISPESLAETVKLRFEGGLTYQNKNDFSIGINSSRKNLAEESTGPVASYRAMVSYLFSDTSEVRFMYAPLSASTGFTPTSAFSFRDKTFAAGTKINTNYVFNSYRLGYIYSFGASSESRFRLGGTVLLRQASIELEDGTQRSKLKNLGPPFPLLYLGYDWVISKDLSVNVDFDSLYIPGTPGRALDFGIFANYKIFDGTSLGLGYRTFEGGIDKGAGGSGDDDVYNYSWFNSVYASLQINL
jgi:hypothetical protein